MINIFTSLFTAIRKLQSYLLVGSVTTLLSYTSLVHAVDPNCQVNVNAGGPIANAGNPSQQNRREATDVIAQLVFADLYRNPPFRIIGTTVRLDAQGHNAAGDANWQVQINGPQGHSTIAHAQVAAALGNASTADRQVNVQRRVRRALNDSLNSGNSYAVTGLCN